MAGIDKSEVIQMLKIGQSEAIEAYARSMDSRKYPGDFPAFMELMLREHKISRKNVALSAGLSQDYTYKLLRGDKHTTERDYIIAICMAAEMTLAQTQHALSIYGMPVLSSEDTRSYLIQHAICNHVGMDRLNDMLERVSLPALRTSPDMPRARITSTREMNEPLAQAQEAESGKQKAPGVRHVYEELDSGVNAAHNGGNAPFDYDYEGWIRLRDETGAEYYVEATYSGEFSSFLVFTEAQRKVAERLMEQREQAMQAFMEAHKDVLDATGNMVSMEEHPELYEEWEAIQQLHAGAETLELYFSLEDAADSAFFPFFLELEKRTDQKVTEVMNGIDDTRNYGSRIGMTWEQTPQIHMEIFNDKQPERREYFQIVYHADGSCRYTATHESCYMRLEMGEGLYSVYFGNRREPEYFIDAAENAFTGTEVRYRFIFTSMMVKVYEYAQQLSGLFPLDPQTVEDEKLEYLLECAAGLHQSGRDEEAIAPLQDAIRQMEENGEVADHDFVTYITVLARLAISASCTGRYEMEAENWKKLYAQRDRILAWKGKESFETLVSALMQATIRFMHAAFEAKDETTASGLLREGQALLEAYGASADDWQTQFDFYANLAFHTESTDLDAAVQYYRKAISIAQNHHLDQVPGCSRAVAMQYNNLGWVLWNRLGSEEAVIYYGRCLELLESYLYTGVLPEKTVLELLAHAGNGLNRIYLDTGRAQETARLKARLAENGVEI